MIWRVVQEGIATLQLRVKLLHRFGHHVWPDQDMNGKAVGGREQLTRTCDDATRENLEHG